MSNTLEQPRSATAEEARQALLQSVDDSIAHFEATGLHLTHDEVKKWAKELQTNRDAKLPECHA